MDEIKDKKSKRIPLYQLRYIAAAAHAIGALIKHSDCSYQANIRDYAEGIEDLAKKHLKIKEL